MFNWLLPQDKKPSAQIISFTPTIQINPKSTLYVEVEPKDPHTASNIVITAFASKQNRSMVPVRVEWSRFKIKTDQQHTSQKFPCLIGTTYMCEPADVGSYIQAKVQSSEDAMQSFAEVTIGPIRIDVMIRRLIDGALYSGSLLSQVVVAERDMRRNITLRIGTKTLEFVDDASQEKLIKEYTMSEPRIELNPKDPTKVYLRFQRDTQNQVREWLNSIFNSRNFNADESSNSIKVPHSVHSSGSSRLKLFQKNHAPCPNKLQLRFISRHSRDLFLFTQRAFICREDMKNSMYLQRIETLQNIATDADYHKFLEFMSLKLQICRIADYAKEVEDDRDAKVKDLTQMEESIGEMTLTYLKIIEEKGKNEHIDFEQSYSQISMQREQIMGRKNLREIKNQNESLKQRLREMTQEIEILKFFRKEDNESMIFNQTSNPFARKPNVSNIQLSPEHPESKHRNMFQMSMNYANLLQENRRLRGIIKKSGASDQLDKSKDMIEILGLMENGEEEDQKEQIQALRKKVSELQKKLKGGINMTKLNRSIAYEQAIANNSNYQSSQNASVSLSQSFINQSMTSEAEIRMFQQKVTQLANLNNKLQADCTRLRQERDYFRNECQKSKQISEPKNNRKDSGQNLENSVIYRIKQENQNLQNQRNALLKKIDSLTRQTNNKSFNTDSAMRERRIQELWKENQSLISQNMRLKSSLQNTKSYNSLNKSDEYPQLIEENKRLKKVNLQLLQEIKNLKIQIEKRNDNRLANSRVIQLQNQLQYMKGKQQKTGNENEVKELLEQNGELKKIINKLKAQGADKQAKIDNQTATIEKLMNQHTIGTYEQGSNSKSRQVSSNSSSKQKSLSDRCNSADELQKYKKKVKDLQQEIILMKRSSDAMNRSRDLSMDMQGYYEQKFDLLKKQMDALYVQNENLSKMCEKYAKDARQANKQMNKWRQKAMEAVRARLALESSTSRIEQ